MGSLGWLSIADLHVGAPGMATLWPSVEDELRRDLERVHKLAGPFDFVLCAGDLVQSGAREEFDALTERLDALYQHLDALGSRPALLVVPGNHDLARPDERAPAVRPMLHWSHDPELRGNQGFWHETNGKPFREVIAAAFEEFTRWTRAWDEAHPLPEGWSREEAGLLPGDFAVTVRKDGVTVGVVGLNSAFLQLTPTVHRGGMAIHPHQLQKLCGDARAWTSERDLSLLLTHHPPDWLTPDALPLYQGTIFRPEHFAAHFCGHMHEPQTIAGQPAGQASRLFQSPSLLGLEQWIDARGNGTPRAHGYSAGRLSVDADRRATLNIWPRLAQPNKSTPTRFRLIPNHADFDLDDDSAFTIDLGARPPIAPARSMRFASLRPSPMAPAMTAPPAAPPPAPPALVTTPALMTTPALDTAPASDASSATAVAPPIAGALAPPIAGALAMPIAGALAPPIAGAAAAPARRTSAPPPPPPGGMPAPPAFADAAPSMPLPTLAPPVIDRPAPPSSTPSPALAFKPVEPSPIAPPKAAAAAIDDDTDDAPEPPGLGYNPRWYVPNEPKEQLILGTLRHPGAPVVVTAPPFSGKSTVLQRIVARLRDEHRSGREKCLVLLLDLGSLGDHILTDPPAFFVELAQMIVDAYKRAVRDPDGAATDDADTWVETAWKRPGAPETRVTSLVERRVLAGGHERMVLAIDRADRFVGKPCGDPMARMLRQWVRAGALGDPRWAPFRLALAAAGSALYFYAPDAVSELFASATHIRIETFGLPDVRAMATLYGGHWTDAELDRLVDMLDGQPYLCRMILFLECSGVPKAELLDVDRLKIEHCATVLRQVWLRVAEQPDLRKPLCLLLRDPTTKLTTDEYHRLYQAGLVRRVDGTYVLPNKLIASYFKEQC